MKSALAEVTLYRKALSMTGAEFDKNLQEIKDFFKQIHEETEALPPALRENKEVARLHANDVKNRLTAKVKELFGIDYRYDIDCSTSDEPRGTEDLTATVDGICNSLDKTLNTIFMHREEKTYIVSKTHIQAERTRTQTGADERLEVIKRPAPKGAGRIRLAWIYCRDSAVTLSMYMLHFMTVLDQA